MEFVEAQNRVIFSHVGQEETGGGGGGNGGAGGSTKNTHLGTFIVSSNPFLPFRDSDDKADFPPPNESLLISLVAKV